MKIDSIGRDVAYIKHSLKNCRISPSNEGKTQETQGSYAHLFVTHVERYSKVSGGVRGLA
jgi:hypothetical protein